MARHYYWLKLNDDFFRDSSVKKLRSIAGGDTYTIIYLKLLLLSLPTDGKLYYEGLDEDFASQVALEIDEEVENVNVTLRFLEARRILIQNTDSEFELSTEPEMVGSESESAKRMRKLRQRQLLLSENPEQKTSQCDGYVTASDENVTQSRDKSRDKSKSIEKSKRKELEKEDTPLSGGAGGKKKPKGFVPPTLEEVEAYCKERNSSVDPKQFYEYFTVGKWVDSKGEPVKNWKQKLITWEKYRNGGARSATPNKRFECKHEDGEEDIRPW